jgi:hypothetical protein
MADSKAEDIQSRHPNVKSSLRLWSDNEPLAPVICHSSTSWKYLYVKGQVLPPKGRAQAHLVARHYACSDDIEFDDIGGIGQVLAQWLDEIENNDPSIAAFAKAGEIEALLWVAIFGYDEIDTPLVTTELATRAEQAGMKILIENYTVIDENTGNPAKSFFGFNV